MEYKVHTLRNGIRVVHLPVTSPVSYCGILVNAGSREEKEEEHGLAHFIEHVIFKGTKKRKAFHILSRLDDVGGEINAYTTKEDTAFYAAFLKPHFERAFELLSDIEALGFEDIAAFYAGEVMSLETVAIPDEKLGLYPEEEDDE